MPRFAANLSMMFTEVPFLDRFEAAAKAGFTAVEFLFPYDHPAEEVGKRLHGNGLTQALFNLPPGNWDAGEKGFASLPDRFGDLQQSLRTALPYARATGVKRLHLMAGIADRKDPTAVAAFRKSVAWAAEFLAPEGIDVVNEPFNDDGSLRSSIWLQNLGQGYIVDSFMVVVLGGVGQLAGTVYAAMGLGILNKFIEGWAGAVLAKIAVLVLIIVFIQKRPQGIFAMKGRSAEA